MPTSPQLLAPSLNRPRLGTCWWVPCPAACAVSETWEQQNTQGVWRERPYAAQASAISHVTWGCNVCRTVLSCQGVG
jgi:hypothetical protein